MINRAYVDERRFVIGGQSMDREELIERLATHSFAKSGTAAAAPTEHKFASTQLNLDYDQKSKLATLLNCFDPNDLADDGVEWKSHITVLYGLHSNDPTKVAEIIKRSPCIVVELGPTSIFETDDVDVVKIEVRSKSLIALHDDLATLEHTDTQPTYQPHLTLAYVKPGMGEKYAGLVEVEGQQLQFDSVCFSDKTRLHVEIVFDKNQPVEFSKSWDESKHKRGQPKNAGQFTDTAAALKISKESGNPEPSAEHKLTEKEKQIKAAKAEFNAIYQEAAKAKEKATPPPAPTTKEFADSEVPTHEENELQTKSIAWKRKLDDEEFKAVAEYCGENYESINDALRTCGRDEDCHEKEGTEKAYKQYQAIHEAIAKFGKLAKPVTVYRGVGSIGDDLLELAEEQMAKGKGIKFKGLVSTSLDEREAAEFASKVIVKIKAHTGAYIAPMSGSPAEKEFLQDHGTQYKVLKIDKDVAIDALLGNGKKRKCTVIELEEVPA